MTRYDRNYDYTSQNVCCFVITFPCNFCNYVFNILHLNICCLCCKEIQPYQNSSVGCENV